MLTIPLHRIFLGGLIGVVLPVPILSVPGWRWDRRRRRIA
jgi:hypothetical protein